MAINLDLIIMFSFLIGLGGIFVGILLVSKSAGKLKYSTILLTITAIIYTIGLGANILNILGIIDLTNKIFLNNLIDLGIGLFLFFSLFSLLTMIKEAALRKHK